MGRLPGPYSCKAPTIIATRTFPCVINTSRLASTSSRALIRISPSRQRLFAQRFSSNSRTEAASSKTAITPLKAALILAAATFAISSFTLSSSTMSSKLIPSDPASVMVVRNVTPNIATFSVPFSRMGRIKIGGRGTLVKLTSSGLVVFSPVALTEETKAKVAEMGGDVKYIVALDYEHHIFISEWATAYPEAKLIGPEGLPEKRAKQNDPKIGKEPFAVVFTKENKLKTHIGTDFDADFDYEYVDAHANKELVFLYKPEKVVIEADLLFNLPPTEQYSKAPAAERDTDGGVLGKLFNGLMNNEGDAKWIRRFNWYTAKDRVSFHDSVQRIDQWDFDTIIPCHGDVMQGNGKTKFRNVFAWHLQGHK